MAMAGGAGPMDEMGNGGVLLVARAARMNTPRAPGSCRRDTHAKLPQAALL
jgi:hypothetical protein